MIVNKKLKILLSLFIVVFFILFFSKTSLGASFDFTYNEEKYSLNLDDEITKFKYIVFTYYVSKSGGNYYHRGAFFVSNEPITFTRVPTDILPDNTEVTSSGSLYYRNFNISSTISSRRFSILKGTLEKMNFSSFSICGGVSGSFLHPSYIYGSNQSIYSLDGELEFEVTDDQTKYVTELLGGSGSVNDITNTINNSDWKTTLEDGDSSSIADAPKSVGNAFDKLFGIFNFIDKVKASVLTIYNTITNTDSVPYFAINIDSEYLKNNCIIVDLSWYSKYKNLGDNVICMFFYLGFIWHTFTKLSSIISGADTSVNTVTKVVSGGDSK